MNCLPPDPRLRLGVRLNSIVKRAWEHDVIPVLLVLGHLSQQARRSFSYQPQTEVFLPDRPTEPFTDIDILALVDGRFVIGEVKTSAQGFSDKDFEKMRVAALRLKPERLLFSALQGEPSPELQQRIAELKAELGPQTPAVDWLSLPSFIYAPSL